MSVRAHSFGFKVMKVAAQHCDELCSVLKQVDADERGIVACLDMPVGHSRYHQNLALGWCPPAVVRLELLRASPKGTLWIMYAMGQDVGQQGEDRVLLMRHRLQRRLLPMWWRRGQPWTEVALAPV
jgi:hypothetical protein